MPQLQDRKPAAISRSRVRPWSICWFSSAACASWPSRRWSFAC